MAQYRLFIAIETPEDVRSAAAKVQAELRTAGADVAWEREEKMHCTLRFLGDTPEDRIPPLLASLDAGCQTISSFPMQYRGTGFFPNDRAPRVLWLGILDPDGGLNMLSQAVEERLTALGFERENRPFHPHLTLGRIRSLRNIQGLHDILKIVTFESKLLQIKEIAVIRSDLKPSGSVYTVVKRIPLVGKTGRSQ